MSLGKAFLERLQEGCAAGDGDYTYRFQQLAASALSHGSSALNLTHPELVARVHGEFVEAGTELISANTFDANAVCLGRYQLAEKVREINMKGVELALVHAGTQACVAGVVGPLGLTLNDDWDLDTYRDAFRGQISALLEAGAHVIQMQLFGNLAELRLALRVARELGGRDLPVITQAVFNDGGLLESGQNAAQMAESLIACGTDVVGVSGGRGIAGTLNAVKHMIKVTGQTPVAAYPNAGFPEDDNGQIVYVASPDYLADTANRMARLGVRLIGGCCGMSSEAIRAISVSLCTVRSRPLDAKNRATVPATPEMPSTILEPKAGGMLESLCFKHPIIAEIDPPPHLQVEATLNDVRTVVDSGADVISMAENPLASLKVGNIAMAALIMQQMNIQTVCHITCRDRNLLGLQSALMGAHLLGVRGLLAITGDPVPRQSGGGLGKGVFDVHSPGLVRLINQLNRGTTSTGKDLKQETEFSVGVAFNSSTRNMDGEILRLEKKLAEGANFIMTQPVFDVEHARRVLNITGKYGVRVFLGFFPLISARTALYLHNEVPGIQIPELMLERITAAPDAAMQRRIGVEQVTSLIDQLLPEMDGIYLISPHSRDRAAILSGLIQHIRSTQQESTYA